MQAASFMSITLSFVASPPNSTTLLGRLVSGRVANGKLSSHSVGMVGEDPVTPIAVVAGRAPGPPGSNRSARLPTATDSRKRSCTCRWRPSCRWRRQSPRLSGPGRTLRRQPRVVRPALQVHEARVVRQTIDDDLAVVRILNRPVRHTRGPVPGVVDVHLHAADRRCVGVCHRMRNVKQCRQRPRPRRQAIGCEVERRNLAAVPLCPRCLRAVVPDRAGRQTDQRDQQ